MLKVIEKLEEIKRDNPKMSYREIIKGAMKINDFLYDSESAIIDLLNTKYGNK